MPIALARAAPLLLLALAGCTTAGGNPVRDAAQSLGIGPKPVTVPDFIAASRPASSEYMPVGVSAPRPAVRARSPEGVTALQAELEGVRGRNAARAGAARRAGAGVKPQPAPRPAPTPPPAE